MGESQLLTDKRFMELMNKPKGDMTKDDYKELYYHWVESRDKTLRDVRTAIEGYWKSVIDEYWKLYMDA